MHAPANFSTQEAHLDCRAKSLIKTNDLIANSRLRQARIMQRLDAEQLKVRSPGIALPVDPAAIPAQTFQPLLTRPMHVHISSPTQLQALALPLLATPSTCQWFCAGPAARAQAGRL